MDSGHHFDTGLILQKKTLSLWFDTILTLKIWTILCLTVFWYYHKFSKNVLDSIQTVVWYHKNKCYQSLDSVLTLNWQCLILFWQWLFFPVTVEFCARSSCNSTSDRNPRLFFLSSSFPHFLYFFFNSLSSFARSFFTNTSVSTPI